MEPMDMTWRGRPTKECKAISEKLSYAEDRAAYWLAKANELSEKGKKAAAQPMYDKSARWLMKANALRKW